MKIYQQTVKRLLLSGLLGLWCLLGNAVFAGEAPQGLNDAQWQGIQQQIQQDLHKNGKSIPAQVRALSEEKLIASDGAAVNKFGQSISLDGNRLAVGAFWADIAGNSAQGAVYIFDFNGSNWVQKQKLTANDGAAKDRFGNAVFLDGDRLAVGASHAVIGGNTDQGAVYLFNFDGSSWVQNQKLIAGDGTADDEFGQSISLDGNRLAVGAFWADIAGNPDQGAVYVFDFNGSNWSPSVKLTANDGAADDEFGYSLSLEGNRLAVGAFEANIDGKLDQGAVYVFDFNSNIWVQKQKLTAIDGTAKDWFGYSLSLDGNRLAVGARWADIAGNSAQGAVYLFDFNSNIWVQKQKLTANDGAASDGFGYSLSLDGNRLAVGAYGADIAGNFNQGAVYLFDFNSNIWVQKQKLTANDGAADDWFGNAVFLNGNRLAVGAYEAEIDNRSKQGAAYIYDGLPAYYINGISGSWYDPAYDGSGFNVIQLPGGGWVVYYYGYKKNGNGRAQWLLSDVIPGTIAAGQTYTATMRAGFPGNGGSLTNKPTGAGPGIQLWGQVEVTLNSCSQGRIRLTGADGSVTHNVVPLSVIDGLTCTLSTANNVSYTAPAHSPGTFIGLSGAWFDPVYDGSGFDIIQVAGGLAMSFHGYKNGADGEALWLLSDVISQPIRVGETVTVNLNAGFIGNGGSFTQKPTSANSGLTYWGQAEITINQCDAGTIRLTSGSTSVTHNVIPLATVKGVTCAN